MKLDLIKSKFFLISLTLLLFLSILLTYIVYNKNFIFFNKPDKSITINKLLLGDDLITSDKYNNLIKDKKIGLFTNQTGVNSEGTHIIDVLKNYNQCDVTALFAPEHGLDGMISAGEYVKSYIHPKYNIPVYSLYQKNRSPSKDMLENIDTFVVDIQDIGVRYYTYISTMYYIMEAAKEFNKEVIILDRPNPLGGYLVEGPVLEDNFKSFLGVDNIPIIHGMTIAELALFFNRNINCNLSTVSMEGYSREMVWMDTGLEWIPTSPNIPTIESCFSYATTGISEGISELNMEDYFTWIGADNSLNSKKLVTSLQNSNLPGVSFAVSNKETKNGLKLIIDDYKIFNPFLTGLYILSEANNIVNLSITQQKNEIPIFNKLMGTDKIYNMLKEKKNADQIVSSYLKPLENFKKDRQDYLLYK